MPFASSFATLRALAVRLGLARPASASSATRTLGNLGEARAKAMLAAKGYKILASNVKLGFAEADLVCEAPDRRTIVIVEVKTRRTGARGLRRHAPPPEASVGVRKRRKLLAAARYLVKANGWQERPVRVDAVAVEWPDAREPVLRHMVGVASDNR